MKQNLSMIAVGGLVGVLVAGALGIESLLGKAGMLIVGAAAMWGLMKLIMKND